MTSVDAVEARPVRETVGAGHSAERGADATPSSPIAAPQSLAILFQPEVYHLLQIVKKYGPSTRFFSDENSMVSLAAVFARPAL